MKRLALVILFFLVLIGAAYFFFIDAVLRSAIETEASKQWRAQVNIASVNFHVWPTSLALKGVQITNPDNPLHNLVQADSIKINVVMLDWQAHQLIADPVQVHLLRFDTLRADSGAIAGLTPTAAPNARTSAGAGVPSTAQMMEAEKQRAQGELQGVRNDLTTLRSSWQQKLATLPDEATLDSYQQRASALRYAAAGQRSNDASALHRDVASALATARQLQDQFKTDWSRVQQQLAYAKALPERELDRLQGGGDANFTAVLLSGTLKPLLQQLLSQLQAPAAANATQPWQVLVRTLQLDGQLDLGSQPLRFQGNANNLTEQPLFWNVASTVALRGSPDQAGQLSLDGSWDYRRLPSATINLNLDQIPMAAVPLSHSPALSLTLTKASVQSHGQLQMTGNQIDIKWLSHFEQADIAASASGGDIGQAVAEALRNVNHFDLNLTVSGNVNSPTIQLESDLNQILGSAVGQALGQSGSGQGQQMRSEMQTQLEPDLAALRQLENEVEAMQQSFTQKLAALQALSDPRGL